jgi:hypothetical protein
LVQKVKELGSNWPRIASYFVNRSPTTCKNRWTANERHSREQQSQSSSLWRKIYNWFFPGKPELRKKDPDALGRRLGELNERLDPQGLKVDWDVGSAFREDLCAYSALLAAREIRFITGEEGIQHVFITRSKVREFALDLRARLEAYGILIDAPLDMDHLEAIAQHLGIFIILEVGTPYETYSHYTREFNPNAPIIVRIFLFADQNFGHYQIITPQNIEMHYENDCPGDIGGVFTHCPDSLTVPMTSMTTDDIDDIFAQLD